MSLSSPSMAVDHFGNPRRLECLAEDGAECELEKIYQWSIGSIGTFRISMVLPVIPRRCATTSVGPATRTSFFLLSRIG